MASIVADVVPLQALLRAARSAYGAAIRRALVRIGCDDMPGNGIFVLGAIARTGAPLGHIIEQLGVSKQAAGRLVDTLVLRGYLERAVDPEDRRRLTIRLSERGRDAAATSRVAVERIETELIRRVGAECLARTRATLLALIEGGDAGTD